MVSEGEGGAGEGGDDHGVRGGCPAGNEKGVRVEGPLLLPGCVIRESPGRGGGEERGGQVGRGRGHLELAEHGVAALPQVGQIQAPLIILEPLGQGREGSVTATSQELGPAHSDPDGDKPGVLPTRTPCPARGPAQAHQQVLHVAHGLVDVVQNFPAALGRQLHFLPFRRLFCRQGGDQPR